MKFLSAILTAACTICALQAKNLTTLPDSTAPRFELTDRVWSKTPGDASICVWKDDKLAVYTITIDACNAKDNVWWLEIAEKYNCKITWFVVTRSVGDGKKARNPFGTWEEKEKLVALGHDVQSHSATHRSKTIALSADEDYSESVKAFQENMKNNPCLTLAYPGGGLPNDPAAAAKYFIAARGARPPANIPNRIRYMETYSSSKVQTISDPDSRSYLPSVLDPKHKNFRGWYSLHFHGLNKQEKEMEKLVVLLDYIKANEKDFWLPTYSSVVKYGQERDTAKLQVTQNTADAIKFNLTDEMKDELFDYPLTVKVPLPASWKAGAAFQRGKELECNTIEHDSMKYAMIQVTPDRGEVLLINKSK